MLFRSPGAGAEVVFHPSPERVQVRNYIPHGDVLIAETIPATFEAPKLSSADRRMSHEVQVGLSKLGGRIADDRSSTAEARFVGALPIPSAAPRMVCRAATLLGLPNRCRERLLGGGAELVDSLAHLHRYMKIVDLHLRGASFAGVAQFPREGISCLSGPGQEWFSACAGVAYHKQSRFTGFLGRHSWSFEPETHRVKVEGGIEFEAYPLAVTSPENATWTWLPATPVTNLIKDELRGDPRRISEKLHELGTEFGLVELTNPKISFDEISFNPDGPQLAHALAMLSASLAGADAYLPQETESGITFYLVFDRERVLDKELLPGGLAAELVTYLPRVLEYFPLGSHRRAADHHLRYFSDDIRREDDSSIVARLHDGSSVRLRFDRDSRLESCENLANPDPGKKTVNG